MNIIHIDILKFNLTILKYFSNNNEVADANNFFEINSTTYSNVFNGETQFLL